MCFNDKINQVWEELAEEMGGNKETIGAILAPSDDPATPEQIAEAVEGMSGV